MLTDTFGRKHEYLRISLTQHCNLRCFYCMPDEMPGAVPPDMMLADEIITIAEQFVSLGVCKIRLTGGEPFVRKDVGDIIRRLSRMPVALTFTSNGVFVNKWLRQIVEAGISSVNISLDTLDTSRFLVLTKRDNLSVVLENIRLLLLENIGVKINVVVMKGINDDEINDFVEWTKDTPVHVRFIEFMPFSGNRWNSDKVFTGEAILQRIAAKYAVRKLQDAPNDTAKRYAIEGHTGTFAIITTMSQPFCSGCNRLRLTADGKLKNCLFSKEETDLLTSLRNGKDIEPLIRRSVMDKAKRMGGQFTNDFTNLNVSDIINRSMIAIGG